MTWDAADGYVLLFGGYLASGAHISDTWIFANGTWTNITGQVTNTPPALYFPSMAYDPTSGAVVLFGVLSYPPTIPETWSYHNKLWTNITASAGTEPSARYGFAFTQDSTDTGLVLFGGRPIFGPGPLLDTWSFRSDHWTNITATSGWSFGEVATPTASDDPPDHGVFMFGYNLVNSTTVLPATYLFAAGNWHNLSGAIAVQPMIGIYPDSAYVSSLRSVVVYQPDYITKVGGVGFFSTTYAYVGGTWSNLTLLVAGPPAVGFQGTTTSLGGGSGVLAFGGLLANGQFAPYTWVLSGTPQATANASRSVTDVGGTVSFVGAAAGGAAPYSFRWSFGDGTNSSAASPSHAFASAGSHVVTLVVTDLVGRSASSTVTIEVNPPLTAAAAAVPPNTTVGTKLALVAVVSGGTPPYTYEWSLGDGATATGEAIAHAYAKVGSYIALLNVTDALGASASSSTNLVVSAATPTSSGNGSSSGPVSLTSGTGLYLLLAIVLLAIVAAALAVLLARRPGPPRGAAPAYAPTAGAPPAATGSYPPPPPGSG